MEQDGIGRHGPRLRLDPTIRIDLLALVVMAASLVWLGADMRNDIYHNTAAIAELSSAMLMLVAVPKSSSSRSSAVIASPVMNRVMGSIKPSSIASAMNGSGKSIDSSTMACFSSHSVSPVLTCFRPTA